MNLFRFQKKKPRGVTVALMQPLDAATHQTLQHNCNISQQLSGGTELREGGAPPKQIHRRLRSMHKKAACIFSHSEGGKSSRPVYSENSPYRFIFRQSVLRSIFRAAAVSPLCHRCVFSAARIMPFSLARTSPTSAAGAWDASGETEGSGFWREVGRWCRRIIASRQTIRACSRIFSSSRIFPG